MALQERLQDSLLSHQINHTPGQRSSRNDVHFPLTTPRKRNPSIPLLTHAVTEDGQSSSTVLRINMSSTINAGVNMLPETQSSANRGVSTAYGDPELSPVRPIGITTDATTQTSIRDLPDEILRRILDYILGDLRPVNAASTSTGLSHRMRHPRRKDVSELALICPELRAMVQERIYRHIKIKGTRAGLRESQEWFQEHQHLARHVRHIEYWVPVWGDKAAVPNTVSQQQHQAQHQNALQPLQNDFGEITPDFQGIQFRLSTYSATLSQIFDHLGSLFPTSSIFTLEGGHCKNSNMIKHFTSNLFTKYMNQQLRVLPNIKVFAMRGAWNIMRSFNDWNVIQEALPSLTEWHCGYAKPRPEAYNTINEILLQIPPTLRHLDISLDSMFSKDDSILGSTPDRKGYHICEQLGRIAPRLESLSYTGRVCEGFFTAAIEAIEHDKPRNVCLKKLDIVVKSCCRQRIKTRDFVTGDIVVEELGGIMADGAGIGNLVFINSFERLVMGCLNGLATITTLERVKIRYIDLDSPCQQLNPYWTLEGNTITGIWNDRIVERLSEVRKGLSYERLEDGIGGDNCNGCGKKEDDDDDDRLGWARGLGGYGVGLGGHGPGQGASALYPRVIPKSINTGSYKVIADARATG